MWPNLQRPSGPQALCLLLFVLSATPQAHCQSDNSNPRVSSTKPSPSYSTNQTCASRTVNYITHSLPQQCLTSHPSTTTPGPAATAVETAITSSTTTDTISHHTGASADSTAAATASSPEDDEVEEDKDEEEIEEDDDDDDEHSFPSFEEWKAMMLTDSDQASGETKQRKPQDSDSLGDIAAMADDPNGASIDFDPYSDKISELTSGTKPLEGGKRDGKEDQQNKDMVYDDGLAKIHLSKDAGRTCRERFSYSSFDAGATVLKTSPGTKNPRAILTENKDSYLLFECSTDNKFFIVELSDLILVDTVVIANFEFFSSMVRQFRVSVSDRYPVKLDKWVDLGMYGARNSRDIQAFLVENPRIWARYLRIEVLSNYGNEYYCPLSLLRVHGLRMMDSWKYTDSIDGESDEEQTMPEATYEIDEPVEEVIEETDDEHIHIEDQAVLWEQSEWVPYWDKSYFIINFPLNAMSPVNGSDDLPKDEGDVNQNSLPGSPSTTTTEHKQLQDESTTTPADTASEASTPSSPAQFTATAQHSITSPPPVGLASSQATANTAERTSNPGGSSSTTTPKRSAQGAKSSSSTFTQPSSVQKTPSQSSSKSKSSAPTSMKPPNSKSTAAKSSSGSSSISTLRNKTATSTTSSVAPSPTVQDSFFKALSKRIQTLESNTTLSLQYIESQSRFLQEALAKLEKRQMAKVDMFLDALNRTVLDEIRELRTQYDQIWQSTVIALETQREQTEREVVALSSRLGVLADEVVFQKRMAIVQSILLLVCLILVIFTRGFAGGVESYYPSQFFLPSSSRVASPIYPSSPKRSLPSLKIPDNSSPIPINSDGRVCITPRSVQHRSSSLYSVGEEPTPPPSDPDISLSHKRSIASLRAEAIASGSSFPMHGQLNGRHEIVKRSSSTILLDPNNAAYSSRGTTPEPVPSHYTSNAALSSGISNGYDDDDVDMDTVERSTSLPSVSQSESAAPATLPHPAVVHHRRPSPPPRAVSDSALFQYDGDDLVDVDHASQGQHRPVHYNRAVNGADHSPEDKRRQAQQKPLARPHMRHPYPRRADSISSGFNNWSAPPLSSPLSSHNTSHYSPDFDEHTRQPQQQQQPNDYFSGNAVDISVGGQRGSTFNGRSSYHDVNNGDLDGYVDVGVDLGTTTTSTGSAAAAAIRSSLAHSHPHSYSSSSSASLLSTTTNGGNTTATTSTARKPLPALPEDADV